MTCPACKAAEERKTTGRYQADCDSCKIRAIANGQQLFDAVQQKRITPEYKAQLVAAFGDGWEQGHERVKQWRTNSRIAAK